MVNRKAPVAVKIHDALEKARTCEPFPVWMTWEALTERVYGRWGDQRNTQQCARRMRSVRTVKSSVRRSAGLELRMTPEESWLYRLIRKTGYPLYAVDAAPYRPPSRDEVVAAFFDGLHGESVRVDLAKVVSMLNTNYRTTFDVSEVLWWRMGLEQERRREREHHLKQLGAGLDALLTARGCQEARKVQSALRKVRSGGASVCPSCWQEIDPDGPLLRALAV